MTEYSKEQLNQLNKDELIQLVLSRQTEMLQMDRNIQLILEQLADSKRHRFGRSTEKLGNGSADLISGNRWNDCLF